MGFTAALFDFGGVVVDSPFEAFTELEQVHGLEPGALRRINARNPDDNAWAQLERGQIDTTEFARQFAAEAAAFGAKIDGNALVELLSRLRATRDVARPDVLSAIADLRARGVSVGLITNNIAPLSTTPETAWVYDEFDSVVESSVLGYRKPEREIYLAACRALDCSPSEAALLDDLGINLKPARALGMHTIKVVDHAAALAELRRLFD